MAVTANYNVPGVGVVATSTEIHADPVLNLLIGTDENMLSGGEVGFHTDVARSELGQRVAFGAVLGLAQVLVCLPQKYSHLCGCLVESNVGDFTYTPYDSVVLVCTGSCSGPGSNTVLKTAPNIGRSLSLDAHE